MPIDASHLWRQIALGEDTELELKEARFRGDAMHFVVRNRRVAAYKDPSRADVPQFSERAVFEAEPNHRHAGSHVPLCGQRRHQRRPDAAGALRVERAGPADGLVRGERHRVVPRDGGRLVRVRLPLRGIAGTNSGRRPLPSTTPLRIASRWLRAEQAGSPDGLVQGERYRSGRAVPRDARARACSTAATPDETMPRATTQVIDRRRQHGQAEYSPHARTRLASDGRIPRCSRDRR